jgi:LacI family transcriptional regulator
MTDAPTLDDVARRAGVSLATASRVLNGSTRVPGTQLKERVLRAAAELGYTPNTLAQAVARGRSNVVALIVHDIADPYFSMVAAGVMAEAAAHGLLVTMASTQRDSNAEANYVSTFRQYRAQAVILVGSRTTDKDATGRLAEELAAFEAGGGRAVAVTQARLPVDTIEMENAAGASALAEVLAVAGYRRFAVLSGPQDLVTCGERVAGFRKGLSHHGIRVESELVVSNQFTRDGGYAALQSLLDLAADVECVFAVNDVMAIGALAAARDAGIDVPGSLAVAGFDDIPAALDVNPPLTTVRMPLREIGAQAVQLALQPNEQAPRLLRVAGEPLVRASTPGVSAARQRETA